MLFGACILSLYIISVQWILSCGYVLTHGLSCGDQEVKSRLMGSDGYQIKVGRYGPQSIVKFEIYLSSQSPAPYRILSRTDTLLLTEKAKLF